MKDKGNHKKFLNYITNPMSKENILAICEANNIIFERCELYSDFVQSLMYTVFNTYMGDELTSHENQVKHFKWCWDKNISNFKTEGLYFESEDLYQYFFEFIFEVFYGGEKNKLSYIDASILKLWRDLFDQYKPKTNADMDTLVEIYILFEKALKNQVTT